MKRHARRGFTLLELILTAGIVAILMLSLYTALHTAYKARAALNTASARVRTARIALDLIEQNLKSVMPPNASTTATAVLAGPFQGTQNEIDLYCLAHDFGNDNDPLSDGMRCQHPDGQQHLYHCRQWAGAGAEGDTKPAAGRPG